MKRFTCLSALAVSVGIGISLTSASVAFAGSPLTPSADDSSGKPRLASKPVGERYA